MLFVARRSWSKETADLSSLKLLKMTAHWFSEGISVGRDGDGRDSGATRRGGRASSLFMIRKLKSGQYRLYSRKKDETGKRRNLGTFASREKAEKHEREVQYFKRH